MLVELDDEFDAMYSAKGHRSVQPEVLLKATVLMALYSIRSERVMRGPLTSRECAGLLDQWPRRRGGDGL